MRKKKNPQYHPYSKFSDEVKGGRRFTSELVQTPTWLLQVSIYDYGFISNVYGTPLFPVQRLTDATDIIYGFLRSAYEASMLVSNIVYAMSSLIIYCPLLPLLQMFFFSFLLWLK